MIYNNSFLKSIFQCSMQFFLFIADFFKFSFSFSVFFLVLINALFLLIRPTIFFSGFPILGFTLATESIYIRGRKYDIICSTYNIVFQLVYTETVDSTFGAR